MSKERNIRVTGKRREFEVGRFVLAVMVHAETLAEEQREQDTERAAEPSETKQRNNTGGTVWGRESESAAPPVDGKEAA